MLDLGLHGWFTAFACAVQLAYALLSFTHGGRSRGLSLPLGLLCLTVFGWNFADLAREHSQAFEWRYLDVTLAPMTSCFTAHFLIGFVGELRRLRWVLRFVYAYSIVLALLSSTAFFSAWGHDFVRSTTYTIAHIAIVATVALVGAVLIYRHWRRHGLVLERLRTRILIIGALFHAFVGTSELWMGFGIEMPRLASFGTLVSMSLFFVVTFRLHLLEQTVPLRSTAYTSLVAIAGVVGYQLVLQAFNANTGALVVGTFVVTVGVVMTTSRIWVTSNQARLRLERLSFLGQMTDQMAHDLRNPLSVILGNAQILREAHLEDEEAGFVEEQLDTIIAQSQRITRLIDKYRRIGQIEIQPSGTDLARLIDRTLEQSTLRTRPIYRLQLDLEERLPPCQVDCDLLGVALENLIRNAMEAMPEGGELFVSVRRDEDDALVIFKDSGVGMNARTLEHCLEPVFTTKADGSGLGLPFCRQVIEAHGGSIVIDSREGEGTEIRLRLPLSLQDLDAPVACSGAAVAGATEPGSLGA